MSEKREPTIVTSMLVDGSLIEGSGAPIDVFNPATEQLLAALPTAGVEQQEAAFAAARRAFDEGPWPNYDPAERAAAIERIGECFDARAAELLPTLVSEVGTPVTLARAIHIDGASNHWHHFAELAARDLTERLGEHAGPPHSASLVAFRPAGVACAISAYNYPVTIAAWKLGAALAAGCTTVLIPSPRTPLATLLLAEIIAEAELPPGVVNVLATGPEGAKAATERPDLDRISFTGSVGVGKAIMRQAAESLAGLHLELGGKSANIVLPDFELTKDAVAAMHLRYLRNAGQGCASPTRILVHRERQEEFLRITREVYAEVGVGDPWDPGVMVGPLIRPEHRESVEGFIERALDAGGEIIAGGGRPDGPGWFVNPTLIGGLDPDAELAQNEAFGPVGALLAYETVGEAIEIANDTRYGLAAYVSSPDLHRAQAVAARLRAGSVFVNGGGALRSDAPFGGFKQSGVGREGGIHGVREFLEAQHVQWALPDTPATRPEPSAAELRETIGHFATGVTVVTTTDEADRPVGSTANAVSSVSLDPPLVLVCLREESETLAALLARGSFAINVLSHHQLELARRFARRGDDVWSEDILHSRDEGGEPVLEDAIASLTCTVHDVADGGDHRIVIGRVGEVARHHDPHAPLIFYRGEFAEFAAGEELEVEAR